MDIDLNQIWAVLWELMKTVSVLLWKFGEGLLWFYNLVEANAGAPSAYLATGVILIVIPYLVINRMISISQAMLEGLQATLAGKFLMIIGTYLTIFIILFILSQI